MICFFLTAAIVAVYGQTGQFDFVTYDDGEYVYGNTYVKAGLTWEGIVWAFTTTRMSNWNPLIWLSYMLEIQLYGMNPGQHHLTNVLFHVFNSMLLFAALKRMTGVLWQSAFVAALFALHPLHVESVAWISERKDVLSTLFWLLTIWSYSQYAESLQGSSYLITLLFFVLGLMSKPMIVTLPFVLLLLDFWPLKRFKIDEGQKSGGEFFTPYPSNIALIFYEKIPFFIFSGVLSAVTFFAQNNKGSVATLSMLSLDTRLANALISYISYIGKMIWPFHLSVFYPHAFIFPIWQILGAGLLLISVSLIVFWNIRQKPYLVVGWLWYLGTLVPVIGLVQVGLQCMADRYTYIPLIGLFIMFAWGIHDFFTCCYYNKKLLIIISIAIISYFTIITRFQVTYWANSETLYQHAIAVTDQNYVMNYNLGNIFLNQGKPDEAIKCYSQALSIKPDFEGVHNNLGSALFRTGNIEGAIQQHLIALGINPSSAVAHHSLGNILAAQGRLDDAIRHYAKLLQISPDNVKAHNNLGLALIRRGNIDEAMFHFQEALRIQPDYKNAYKNLKRTLAVKERIDNAIFKIRQTLRTPSESPAFCNALNENKQELDRAIDYYQNVLSPQPGYAKESLNIDNYAPVAEVRKEREYSLYHE